MRKEDQASLAHSPFSTRPRDAVLCSSPVAIAVFTALLQLMGPFAPAFGEYQVEGDGFHETEERTSPFAPGWYML